MTTIPFDTLKLAERLQAGGFTPEQARTAASALAEAMTGAELPTKSDLSAMEARLDGRIATSIADAKSDLLRWMVPLLLGQAALIAALVKLL
ncbi:hypothetical protein [Azospirillum halopraeferens]|uniref:hypothetical protein n=1 Tax=Azospirillum halopraeferens TaxID=34010 RepID=UPI000411F40E|nr:hypothetical protein [Azospirillum halopraeferens]